MKKAYRNIFSGPLPINLIEGPSILVPRFSTFMVEGINVNSPDISRYLRSKWIKEIYLEEQIEVSIENKKKKEVEQNIQPVNNIREVSDPETNENVEEITVKDDQLEEEKQKETQTKDLVDEQEIIEEKMDNVEKSEPIKEESTINELDLDEEVEEDKHSSYFKGEIDWTSNNDEEI
jgi:hypothetical protein